MQNVAGAYLDIFFPPCLRARVSHLLLLSKDHVMFQERTLEVSDKYNYFFQQIWFELFAFSVYIVEYQNKDSLAKNIYTCIIENNLLYNRS